MKEIIITAAQQGQRLDKFLGKYMNEAPKGFLYKMLRKKRIKYNGKKAEGNEILAAGDCLTLYLSEETIASFHHQKEAQMEAGDLAVIFENQDVLAVNKPAGLLSHPEKKADRDTLSDRLLAYLARTGAYDAKQGDGFVPALCNRLDRNTSGIVLAGKTLAGVQALNASIRSRSCKKEYFALVLGQVLQKGIISLKLEKDEKTNQVFSSQKGKETLTKYYPIKAGRDFTLLRIELVTGKTHQIRAHMKEMGHPLAGDPKYGVKAVNRNLAEQFGLNRQFLHAAQITFGEETGVLAPLRGKRLQAPLPRDLQRVLQGLDLQIDFPT